MLTGYSKDELQRWAMLRSVEWGKLPLFVSQPIVPVLLLLFEWWILFPAVVVASVLWGALRYRFVSIHLAHFSSLFVRLKWITCPAMGLYFFLNDNILDALLAFFWPFIILVLSFLQLSAIRYGQIERMFMSKMGYAPIKDDERTSESHLDTED